MNRLRSLQASLLAALLLTACATVPAPRTVSQSLVYATSTATAALQVATPLVQQRTISADQGQQVMDSALLVRRAVDTARSMSDRGDAAGAQAQLAAITADLALLEDFIKRYRRSP